MANKVTDGIGSLFITEAMVIIISRSTVESSGNRFAGPSAGSEKRNETRGPFRASTVGSQLPRGEKQATREGPERLMDGLVEGGVRRRHRDRTFVTMVYFGTFTFIETDFRRLMKRIDF
jgi:hypothetical protein